MLILSKTNQILPLILHFFPLSHRNDSEKVAVKILEKGRLDAKTQRMLAREIRTMETLHHPNLIRIFEVIETLSRHYIVMELAPGGELFQVISLQGRLSESEGRFYFAQILSAIEHMVRSLKRFSVFKVFL